MKLNIVIRPGRHDGYVQAYCPDVVGCSATAPTEEEAIRLLRERMEKLMEESGKRPTLPGRVRRVIDV